MSRKLLIHSLPLMFIPSIFFLLSGFNNKLPVNKNGRLVIHFLNIADGKKIAKDSIYQNAFGEAYTVSNCYQQHLKNQLNYFYIHSPIPALQKTNALLNKKFSKINITIPY